MSRLIVVALALLLSIGACGDAEDAARQNAEQNLVGAWMDTATSGMDTFHRFFPDKTARISRGIEDRLPLNWSLDPADPTRLVFTRTGQDGEVQVEGHALFELDGDVLRFAYRMSDEQPENLDRASILVRVDGVTAQAIEGSRLNRRAHMRSIRSF